MAVISVQLRSESGRVLQENLEIGLELSALLPAYEELAYPYLRLIDPYGDTVFSRYQMAAVIPELEMLGARSPSPALDAVLAMARACAASIHTYLSFIGD